MTNGFPIQRGWRDSRDVNHYTFSTFVPTNITIAGYTVSAREAPGEQGQLS